MPRPPDDLHFGIASPSPSPVRPAAVAGTFYPADAGALAATVDRLLDEAPPYAGPPPRALVVPHAGYVYSGPVAASAFHAIRARSDVRHVVLLGPAHRVAFRGVALPEAGAFETPLGVVGIDAGHPALAAVPRSAVVHRDEHSLEVELPFLQRTLAAGFGLVPLVVGDAAPPAVGQLVEALWDDPETLVVVSSDLSHYLPYDLARRVDADTARMVCALDVEGLDHERACGATPLAGLLWVARRQGLRARLLDLRCSGDTAGDHERVVGYGAFVLHE